MGTEDLAPQRGQKRRARGGRNGDIRLRRNCRGKRRARNRRACARGRRRADHCLWRNGILPLPLALRRCLSHPGERHDGTWRGPIGIALPGLLGVQQPRLEAADGALQILNAGLKAHAPDPGDKTADAPDDNEQSEADKQDYQHVHPEIPYAAVVFPV